MSSLFQSHYGFLPLHMHFVEPHFGWRDFYTAENDPQSPFYGREYSEFEFQHAVYNYLIHPQWDAIGSKTLYLKVIYVDYDEGFAAIELIGEWNDTIENDIMTLKRDFIEYFIYLGIDKFILIGENVLNFHASDDCYYEEWFDEVEDGWIAMINLHDHVRKELQTANIDHYLAMGGELDELDWRKFLPTQFYNKVASIMRNRLE